MSLSIISLFSLSQVVIYGKETVPEDGFKSRGRFA
jgi:hypothetical protein